MIFTRNPAVASKCGLENILADINGWDNNFPFFAVRYNKHNIS